MPDKQLCEKSVFLQAIEITSSVERASFLADACGTNDCLRGEIEALLHAHEGPLGLLDVPDSPSSLKERPGSIIGPYKLLEQIGEGGMGAVFMAEQTHPIQRKVALKIVKPGMDSKQVLARFDAERQALALMDHPNIARVLDAGTTESGRPYFVMELVRGVPLTEFCDQHKLTIRQRLELFINVCQAVQHAHQKGIIHRDLKPTNVLVTLHDTKPVVKVIDFGVAKATGQKLTEKTLFTGLTQLIGTPLYMSPEQAEMSGLDVDTRSDIYSLGVLLYELLTGHTPFDNERLKASPFDEMRRIIREEEPPRPSTRLSTLAQQAISTISEKRSSDPRHLSRLFQGDLDWIVMTCLEKDRNRRYETASALATDVEHYLHNEPVEAFPPSKIYRLSKFARRYRAPLLMTSVVIAALILGTIVSTWQAIRATRAEQLAKTSEQQAKTSEQQAKKSEQVSSETARRAEAVLNLMVNILHSPDPSRDGRTVTVVELLDRATKGLQKQFADDPRGKAALLQAIAESYEGLGLYHEAVPLFEQARDLHTELQGKDDPNTIRSMDKLAVAYGHANRLNDAVALAEKTLQLRKAKLPPDDPDVLASMSKLANVYMEVGKEFKAVPLFEEVLKRKTDKLGENDPETLHAMENLAHAYPYARANEALALCEKSVNLWTAKLGPDALATLNSKDQLAVAYRYVGRVNDAISLDKETLQRLTKKLGLEDRYTLSCKENLARDYMTANRLDEALPLFEEVLQAYRKTLGPGHVDTLWAIDGLADAYQLAGRWADAAPLLEEGVRINKSMRGLAHRETLHSIARLANSYQHMGRLDDVILLREAYLSGAKSLWGPDQPVTLEAMLTLADAYKQRGRVDDGLALLADAFSLSKAKLGMADNTTISAILSLADAYEFAGRLDESAALREEFLQLRMDTLGPNDHNTVAAKNQLAMLRIEQGRVSEAEAMLNEDLAAVRGKLPADSGELSALLHHLAMALLMQNKFAEAEAPARESLEIREKKSPNAWGRFHSQTLLGAALLGEEKYAEAEPLLVSGYEGMTKVEAKASGIHKFALRQVLAQLVQLYEATNQPEKAAPWKAKLNDFDDSVAVQKSDHNAVAPTTTDQ